MKKIFLMCLASLLFTACGSDLSNWFEDNTVTLTITADKGTVTRATFDTDGDDITATWDATDKLIVVVNGYQSELSLESGAGTTTATFSGELECGGVKPSATTRLDVYVKNDNITIRDDGSYVYTGTALTSQPGTLDGATALGVYMATPAYGDGTISGVTFAPVTSLVKFAVTVPEDMEADTEAMLSYSFKTGHVKTTISAPFTTVAHPAATDVWLAVPAGTYTANRLRLVAGKTDIINSLSNNASLVTLAAATKYNMAHEFDPAQVIETDAEALSFQALADGQVVITNPLGLEITYCVNDGVTTTKNTATINIDVPANGVVSLFGDNARYATGTDANKYTTIDCNVDCYVYGNIMSLINSITYPTLTTLTGNYTFYNLFKDNIHLKNHPTKELTLPATTLIYYCYQNMFNGCISLERAPELPATTLLSSCYQNMFSNCTSLEEVPELPAMEMTSKCYQEMFSNCTSLMFPPELPATKLYEYCYTGMFRGCTSLTYAPELPATSLSSYCYQNMFNGCTSLTEAPALPAMSASTYCYNSMFKDCTNLTKAPALPATVVGTYCYQYMFSGCTSLTKAPALPATKVNESSYGYMFQGCNSLTSIPSTLPATTLGTSCYSNMFKDCTSLTKAPTLPATTLTNSCYYSMFEGCTNLASAPALPATTLANSCYNRMFQNCTCLTTAPNLPATTIQTNCYYSMFKGCTNLTTAPAELPAMTMQNSCYYSMFEDCSSLTTPPALPATTVAQDCYGYMFRRCTSLTTAPVLPATNMVKYCYEGMFSGCSSLTTAPALPATSLAEYCYEYIFQNCTSLTTPPVLPATSLAEHCYYAMFIGCTSLTQAPALPATSTAYYCYYVMFKNCTALQVAPDLPATSLSGGCYRGMFEGCTSLTYIKCMATSIGASYCTVDFTKGVGSQGTFVKNPNMNNWTTGVNGIPEGWTVTNAN
jgi:hypothetical protein